MVARRAGAVLLAIMLGAGLAACGDDGGSDDDAVDQVDRDGTGSDDGDDGNTDDGNTDDGNTDDGEDIDLPEGIFGSEECTEIIEAFGAFGGVFTGSGDADFGDLADGFDAIAESAPEIADDLETMADAYRDFDDALGDVDLSDPSIFQSGEFLEAAESFNSEEFTEASENVSAFMDEACAPGN